MICRDAETQSEEMMVSARVDLVDEEWEVFRVNLDPHGWLRHNGDDG